MIPLEWTKSSYEEFYQNLWQYEEIPYRNFQGRLIKSDCLIGIRMPILHKLARQISKTDIVSFFSFNQHRKYEETLLHGLVIGYWQGSFPDILKHIEQFLPFNDNWAINDIISSNLKCFRENRELGLVFIQNCLCSSHHWNIRFAYTLLLFHYLEEPYFPLMFRMCEQYQGDEYYVRMAIAWLLSFCYIKGPEETIAYLKKDTLDTWTHNKAIQKMLESNQVKEKDYLRTLKRSNAKIDNHNHLC